MTDQIAILTIAVSMAFAFGMAAGVASERARQRRRRVQKEIDWMLESPKNPMGESGGEHPGIDWLRSQYIVEPGDWPHRDSFVRRPR